MVTMISFEDITSAFKSVGLRRGDTVLVHSSLSKIGAIKGIERTETEKYLACIYRAFFDVLDIPEGTLVVPTFTHEYARNNKPYIHEESPSEVGAFSEYIRRHPDAVRSVHPINSFAVVGSKQHEICHDISRACYGFNSVFDRLILSGATMLFLGASMRHMTLKHHMEHVVGLPYAYHKAYFTPAYRDGKELPLPFLACVRYLNGKVENNDCSEFQAHLETKKLIKKTTLGDAEVIAVSIKSAFEEAYDLLQADPCYFLEKSYYQTV